MAGTPFILTQSTGTARNDSTICVGFKFTVGAASITVDSLGRWKISGNSQVHTLRIMSGISTTLVTTNVDMSTGSTGGFVYASCTPTVLSASTDYWVFSSETNGGDQWYNNDFQVNSTTAFATVHNAYYENVCGIDLNSVGSDGFVYGAPNFTGFLGSGNNGNFFNFF